MKVLLLGSNGNKNAGKEQEQDWTKICWKEVEKWKLKYGTSIDGILRNGYLES